MDFFQSQEQARKKTGLLIAYFLVRRHSDHRDGLHGDRGILRFADPAARTAGRSTLSSLWDFQLFGAVAVGTSALIAGGSLYKMAWRFRVVGTRWPS